MPDGTVIAVADFRSAWLYSTAEVGGWQPLEPFECGRSQQMAGGMLTMTLAHTNLHRSSSSGLPHGYEFIAFGWHAEVIAPAAVVNCDAMAAWLASTSIIYKYRQKHQSTLPLGSLVWRPPARAPEEVTAEEPPPPPVDFPYGQPFTLPIQMQHNLSFGVTIEPQSSSACSALRVTLKHVGARCLVRVFLRGLYKEPVY